MVAPRALFLTDLDGTLLAPDGSVPARNLAAMRRASEAGVALVVATGRRRSTIRREHAKLEGVPYRVSASNGAVLLAEDHETPVYVAEIPWSGFHDACAAPALAHAACIGVTMPPASRSAADEEPDCLVLAPLTREAALARSTADDADREPADLARVTRRPLVHAAFVLATRKEAEASAGLVARAFSGRASVHVAKRPNGPGFFLEAVRKGGKGAAARALAEDHGLPPVRVGAVGDDMNDASLLDAAGRRYAVGGSPLASSRADAMIVSTALDGAVGDALERFLQALG